MQPLDLSPDAAWRKRFALHVVPISQVAARNNSRGLAVSNQSGVYQLYAWDVATGGLNQLTDAPAGMVFGGISPDGRYIYYHRDTQGDEIGHLVRIPFEGGEVEDMTPDMPDYSLVSMNQSLDGSRFGFCIGHEGFIQYVVDVAADGSFGTPRQLYRSSRLTSGPVLSADGRHALVVTTERSQVLNRALLAFNVDTAEMISVLQDADASIQAVGFSPIDGDTRVLATTNVTGFVRPVIWDVATQTRIDLPFEDMDGDIYPSDWSPDGKRILLRQYVKAEYHLHVYDLEKSTLTALKHPAGSYGGCYFYDNETIFVHHEDSQNPTQLMALDAQTGARKRIVLAAAEPPASQAWRSVSFPGANGDVVQGWLSTPAGDGPWPTILETHGGPTAVQTETFDPVAQAWTDHGFAFFTLNYHGSVTFGRQFEQSIYGQLGELESEDMAAAYHWLVNNGIARRDEVLLTGGSYGGYLTLLGIGKNPDLYAGGMALVAIGDWALMYEDQAEVLRGYQRSLFGGTPEEMPEQHAKSSPITYAEAIRAPVLVIQGENDTRCPARQMRVYEDKLRALKKDIQIEWFDAGHGSRAIDQNIAHMELMLHWAHRVLG